MGTKRRCTAQNRSDISRIREVWQHKQRSRLFLCTMRSAQRRRHLHDSEDVLCAKSSFKKNMHTQRRQANNRRSHLRCCAVCNAVERVDNQRVGSAKAARHCLHSVSTAHKLSNGHTIEEMYASAVCEKLGNANDPPARRRVKQALNQATPLDNKKTVFVSKTLGTTQFANKHQLFSCCTQSHRGCVVRRIRRFCLFALLLIHEMNCKCQFPSRLFVSGVSTAAAKVTGAKVDVQQTVAFAVVVDVTKLLNILCRFPVLLCKAVRRQTIDAL